MQNSLLLSNFPRHSLQKFKQCNSGASKAGGRGVVGGWAEGSPSDFGRIEGAAGQRQRAALLLAPSPVLGIYWRPWNCIKLFSRAAFTNANRNCSWVLNESNVFKAKLDNLETNLDCKRMKRLFNISSLNLNGINRTTADIFCQDKNKMTVSQLIVVKNKPESFQPLKASQTFQYFKK